MENTSETGGNEAERLAAMRREHCEKYVDWYRAQVMRSQVQLDGDIEELRASRTFQLRGPYSGLIHDGDGLNYDVDITGLPEAALPEPADGADSGFRARDVVWRVRTTHDVVRYDNLDYWPGRIVYVGLGGSDTGDRPSIVETDDLSLEPTPQVTPGELGAIDETEFHTLQVKRIGDLYGRDTTALGSDLAQMFSVDRLYDPSIAAAAESIGNDMDALRTRSEPRPLQPQDVIRESSSGGGSGGN